MSPVSYIVSTTSLRNATTPQLLLIEQDLGWEKASKSQLHQWLDCFLLAVIVAISGKLVST